MTLIDIAVKVYNALLLKHIKSEIQKFLIEIWTIFGEIDLQLHSFLTIRWIIGVRAKKSRGLTPIHRFL